MALLVFKDEILHERSYELGGAAYLFNRSENQCKFLFELCDQRLNKYIALENAIKRLGINYCPGTKEEVEKVLYGNL